MRKGMTKQEAHIRLREEDIEAINIICSIKQLNVSEAIRIALKECAKGVVNESDK